MASSEQYEFGPFRLEADQHRLWREDAEVELPPKALDTLILLVRRAGQLVGRDEFFATLWPNTVVTEASLGRHIWLVRRALGQGEGEGDYIQTVPKKGYRFVKPVCRSEATPESVTEVKGDLPSGEPAGAMPAETLASSKSHPQPRRFSWWWPGVALAAMAVATVVVTLGWSPFLRDQRSVPAATDRATKERATVALFDFVPDNPAAVAWLPAALTDLLGYELSLDEKLRVIQGQPLAKLISVTADREPDPALLNRLHRQLGIALAVIGRYHAEPGTRLRLVLRVIDTATGKTLETVAVRGDRRYASELIVAAGNELRDRLSLGRMSSALEATRRTTMTNDRQTLQSYAEGMLALRHGDINAGKVHLTTAVKREPNFIPAKLALIRVLLAQGYDSQAAAIARDGLNRASGAPRELRLALEARMHESERVWPRAIEVYRELYRLYPEEIEYGMDLVRTLAYGGKTSESFAIIDEMRRRGSNPRVEFLASTIAAMAGDGEKARMAAERSLKNARELQAPMLIADALSRRGIARRLLGDKAGAMADYEEAHKGFRQQGDPQMEGAVIVSMGILYAEQGDFTRAKTLLQEALAAFERGGYKAGIGATQLNLASIEQQQGHPVPARRRMEVALQAGRELGSFELQSAALTGLGILQFNMGETAAALATYSEALDVARQSGMKSRESNALEMLSYVQRQRGQYSVAQDLANEALAIARGMKNPRGEARALALLGQVQFDTRNLSTARRNLEAALSLYRHGKMDNDVATTELDIAGVALDESKPREALKLLDHSLQILQTNEDLSSVAMCRALRAEALLALGQTGPARKSLENALAYTRENTDSSEYIPILLSEARFLAARGEHDEALDRLRRINQIAAKRDLGGVVVQTKRLRGKFESHLAQAH